MLSKAGEEKIFPIGRKARLQFILRRIDLRPQIYRFTPRMVFLSETDIDIGVSMATCSARFEDYERFIRRYESIASL
jgi:hypothetical protein